MGCEFLTHSYYCLVVFELILLVILMLGSWFLLKLLFRDKPKLRVMGLFGCTQKTVAGTKSLMRV